MFDKKKSVLIITTFVLALGLLVPALCLADSVEIVGYTVELVGYEAVPDSVPHQTVVTYAVTYNCTGVTCKGLSHIVWEQKDCFTIISPTNGGTYDTITEGFGCGDTYTTCLASTYDVEIGTDTPTGIYGVKFQDPFPAESQLSKDNPGTHIFQFTVGSATVDDSGNHWLGTINVGGKAGDVAETGQIAGPVCSDPTSVRLRTFIASSPTRDNASLLPWILGGASLLVILSVIGLVRSRRLLT